MSNVYMPLREAVKQDVYPIFFYLNDQGEAVGGLCHATTQKSAGDRKIHVVAHDAYHGHLIPADKKAIKEGTEMKTYSELLSYINEAKQSSPNVYHYATRGENNGGGPLYQEGSLSREKTEKMAGNRPYRITPLHAYKGHLSSVQWNG